MFSTLIIAAGAVILALTRGGSLESLASTKFRWVWLIFAGLAVQLGFDIWSPGWLTENLSLAVLLASNVLIALFLLLNRRIPGTGLAAVGLALNVLVIGANGAMPVSATAARAAGVERSIEEAGIKHEPMDPDTVLPWLGDAIPVPGLVEVLSVGDVVLALGIGRLLYMQTSASKRGRHRVCNRPADPG